MMRLYALVILHKISKDMEEQMVQIGVLEALGYTSRELSCSYILRSIFHSIPHRRIPFPCQMLSNGIPHSQRKDMEEQMVQIGVLEALGYTSRELSCSYICEYILTGGILYWSANR